MHISGELKKAEGLPFIKLDFFRAWIVRSTWIVRSISGLSTAWKVELDGFPAAGGGTSA